MLRSLLLLCACVGGLSLTITPADEPASGAEQEIVLFDGKSLDGWIQRGGTATYEIVDGTIVGTSRPNTPNSFLCTAETYGDFELTLEFNVDDGLNSGVQVRSQSRPDYQNGRVHGYQVEIDSSERGWTGGIYDEGRRGWLTDLAAKPGARVAIRPSEWNRMRVRAEGPHLQTWINDTPVADLTDDMDPRGFMALQVHSVDQEAPLRVRWRNIRLKPL